MKDVYNAKFDHSGRRLVTGSDDHLVKIWSVQSGQLLHSLRGHEGDITMLAINGSNTLIASADNRGFARLWCLHTGRAGPVLAVGEKGEEITHVTFMSANETEYIVCGCRNGCCVLWRVSEDPERVAQCDDRQCVRIAAPSPGQGRPAPALGHEAPEVKQVICLDINPRGTHFAVGCDDCNVYLYDVFSGPQSSGAPSGSPLRSKRARAVACLRGHTAVVEFAKFGRVQRDGVGALMTSSEDGTVRIWRRVESRLGAANNFSSTVLDMRPRAPRKSGVRKPPAPPKVNITSVLWGLDGSRVVAAATVKHGAGAGATGTLRVGVYDVQRALESRLNNAPEEDRQLFALGSDGCGHVQNDPSVEVHTLFAHPSDKRLVLSACTDGKAVLWDIYGGAMLRRIEVGSHIQDGAFSPDGLHFVLSDNLGYFSLYGSGPAPNCLREQFFLQVFVSNL
jgi:WD40 repeat protein